MAYIIDFAIFSHFNTHARRLEKKKLMILTRWLKCKLQSDVLSHTFRDMGVNLD